jgi:hypothetical protein
VSGYGAASCTPISAAVSTDTQKLLSPTFAYQRSLAFVDGNIDPNALTNLYAITAAPIVGFFAIPLMVLGFLHVVIWMLGRWIALWAPLPEPRTWHQYFRSFSLPTLPTFAGVQRFLSSLFLCCRIAPRAAAGKPWGPSPAQLREEIDAVNDALLIVAFDDPSRPYLLARLHDLRATLKAAEAPPRKEEKKPEGEAGAVQRLPASTWVGRRKQAWENRLDYYAAMLDKVDLYCAIKNEFLRGVKVQVSKPTPLGGGVSVIFIGVLFAVCAMLIEQYSLSNNAAATGSIKLTAWEIDMLGTYPSYQRKHADLTLAASPLAPGPGFTSGMQVTIRTHGRRCAAPLKTEGLMAVSNFTARAPLIDAASGAATHVFDCGSCMADTLSSLSVTFDPSCASFDITTAAIGAWGSFSMFQITAPSVAGLTASFSVLPQQVLDFVGGSDPTASGYPTGGRSFRGIFIDSGALLSTTPYNATAMSAGTALPTVITLTFPATSLFTRITLDVRLTILQLINGLLGNLGILGGAAIFYTFLARLYEALEMGGYAALIAVFSEVSATLGCAPLPTELTAAIASATKLAADAKKQVTGTLAIATETISGAGSAVMSSSRLVSKDALTIGDALKSASETGALEDAAKLSLGLKDDDKGISAEAALAAAAIGAVSAVVKGASTKARSDAPKSGGGDAAPKTGEGHAPMSEAPKFGSGNINARTADFLPRKEVALAIAAAAAQAAAAAAPSQGNALSETETDTGRTAEPRAPEVASESTSDAARVSPTAGGTDAVRGSARRFWRKAVAANVWQPEKTPAPPEKR